MLQPPRSALDLLKAALADAELHFQWEEVQVLLLEAVG